VSTTPPPTPPSKLQNILAIINLALQGLAAIPALTVPIAIEQAFQQILVNALAAFQAETGKPFDIQNIPLEKPVE
jgi:hypothetical protein